MTTAVSGGTQDEHRSDKLGRGAWSGRLHREDEYKYLRLVTTHCCDQMRELVEHRCAQHPDPHECPDHLVIYVAKFREYGLVIQDGGSAYMSIDYCPWCGSKLPGSQVIAGSMKSSGSVWIHGRGTCQPEFEDGRWLDPNP